MNKEDVKWLALVVVMIALMLTALPICAGIDFIEHNAHRISCDNTMYCFGIS